MRTLEELQGRCVITEEGHWLWRGSVRPDGRANIYAPDYTLADGEMRTQSGLRAMWHCIHEKAVPPGCRIIGICEEKACIAPGHIRCVTEAQYGEYMRRTERFKNSAKRMLANRATGRARSKLSAELIDYIQTSPKTGEALAEELCIGTSTVSRARRGEIVVFPSVGPFTGLVRGLGA